MLLFLFIITYVVIAFALVISLLINGIRPSKTLAWLLAIFTIPLGGMLLYLMFGRNRRKNKLFVLSRDFLEHLPEITAAPIASDLEGHKVQKLIERTTKIPITALNSLVLLKDGKETFESIFKALERAQNHIHIQYYIFEDGLLAQKFLELFEKKRRQNVSIRLIYDGIGSYSLSKGYIKKLKSIGVEVEQFLPFRLGRFLAALNYRNHRKIIVVDNQVGFTGGINISDKYLKGDPDLGRWHDIHLQLKGEAVAFLNRVFLSDWYLASGKSEGGSNPPITASKTIVLNQKTHLQIVPSGPDDDFAIMEQVYFTIINQAKEYLYIANPYIIPSQAILQSLKTASLSGVDVKLLLSATTDSKVVDWCVRAYFEAYLKAGIKIYLYPYGFLHSKMVISDTKIASIGTANLDDRSLQQNYEVNVIIYDQKISADLKNDFLKNCSKSQEVDLDGFLQRSWRAKIREGSAKLLSPLL